MLGHEKSDNTAGGDLQILSCKQQCKKLMSDRDKKEIGVSTVGRHEQYNPKDLRLESEIMYGRNTLVMFINSPVSVHAVTPRRNTIVVFSKIKNRFLQRRAAHPMTPFLSSILSQ